MPIEDFTDDELRNEIKKREVAAVKPESIPVGEIASIDLVTLRNMCQDYIDCLANNERYKDVEEVVFEQCVSMFFGASVWDWINERSE